MVCVGFLSPWLANGPPSAENTFGASCTWQNRLTALLSALVPMRTIPDVELHVLPNCGHWAMIEQKSAWEAVVLAFRTRAD